MAQVACFLCQGAHYGRSCDLLEQAQRALKLPVVKPPPWKPRNPVPSDARAGARPSLPGASLYPSHTSGRPPATSGRPGTNNGNVHTRRVHAVGVEEEKPALVFEEKAADATPADLGQVHAVVQEAKNEEPRVSAKEEAMSQELANIRQQLAAISGQKTAEEPAGYKGKRVKKPFGNTTNRAHAKAREFTARIGKANASNVTSFWNQLNGFSMTEMTQMMNQAKAAKEKKKPPTAKSGAKAGASVEALEADLATPTTHRTRHNPQAPRLQASNRQVQAEQGDAKTSTQEERQAAKVDDHPGRRSTQGGYEPFQPEIYQDEFEGEVCVLGEDTSNTSPNFQVNLVKVKLAQITLTSQTDQDNDPEKVKILERKAARREPSSPCSLADFVKYQLSVPEYECVLDERFVSRRNHEHARMRVLFRDDVDLRQPDAPTFVELHEIVPVPAEIEGMLSLNEKEALSQSGKVRRFKTHAAHLQDCIQGILEDDPSVRRLLELSTAREKKLQRQRETCQSLLARMRRLTIKVLSDELKECEYENTLPSITDPLVTLMYEVRDRPEYRGVDWSSETGGSPFKTKTRPTKVT